MQCSTNAEQYNAVLHSTVQHSTVQYSTVQYSTVQYSTVQYSKVQYNTVQYSTVSAMQCIALHCIALHCIAVQSSTVQHLRNRKHVPCFYRVIRTRVEVMENEKCCGNTSRRRVFPQPFRVLPNFHECLYNSIETRSTCFLFLLENATTKKGKQLVNFDYQNVNSLCSRYHYVNSAR